MGNPFKRYFKTFLSYPRSDRNAIVVLSTLLVLILVANYILKNKSPLSDSDYSEVKKMLEDWELKSAENEKQVTSFFLFDPNTISERRFDSLSIPYYLKQNIIAYRNAGGVYKSVDDLKKIYGMTDSIFHLMEAYVRIEEKEKFMDSSTKREKKKPLFFFDPNTADISELLQLNFSSFQANNLVSYRNNGGRFKTATDLIKIYGIDSSFYNRISMYIKIEELATEPIITLADTLHFDLNSIDSVTLVKFQGIGPAYAKRILKYRNLLGGYYSKEQLKEIYNFPEETYFKIEHRLYTDTLKVNKLRINFVEYRELLRHPYFNKAQVKAILQRRERQGAFKDPNELEEIEGFDSELIKKIRPYIAYR